VPNDEFDLQSIPELTPRTARLINSDHTEVWGCLELSSASIIVIPLLNGASHHITTFGVGKFMIFQRQIDFSSDIVLAYNSSVLGIF
jgi:hypothetical protein